MSRGDGASHLGDSTPPGLAGASGTVCLRCDDCGRDDGTHGVTCSRGSGVVFGQVVLVDPRDADLATLRAKLDAVTRERDEARQLREVADASHAVAIKERDAARVSNDRLIAELDGQIEHTLAPTKRAIEAMIEARKERDAARLDLAAATLRAERAERVVEAGRSPYAANGWFWCRFCAAPCDEHRADCALAAYDRETGARS